MRQASLLDFLAPSYPSERCRSCRVWEITCKSQPHLGPCWQAIKYNEARGKTALLEILEA